jgi:YVTN family beta-propeller protein
VDVTRARAFVANFNRGSVSVIDARRGALVRTIRVGGGPAALAVDEGSGHVFVANFGAGTVSMLDGGRGRLIRTVPGGAVPVKAGRLVILSLRADFPSSAYSSAICQPLAAQKSSKMRRCASREKPSTCSSPLTR